MSFAIGTRQCATGKVRPTLSPPSSTLLHHLAIDFFGRLPFPSFPSSAGFSHPHPCGGTVDGCLIVYWGVPSSSS